MEDSPEADTQEVRACAAEAFKRGILRLKVWAPNFGPYLFLSCLGSVKSMGPSSEKVYSGVYKDSKLEVHTKGPWL